MPQLHNLPRWLQRALAYRRSARLTQCLRMLRLPADARVLDIGCGIDGRSFSDYAPQTWNITGVDLHESERIRHRHPRFSYVKCSAADLSPFASKQFDLAISVGMLEHILGDTYDQAVGEIQRVAKSYVVIVPWRWAVIEPHFAFPLFGVLPRSLQEFVIAQLLHRRDPQPHLEYFRENFAWRSNATYRRDFPGSRLVLSHTLDTIGIVGGEFAT